MVRNPAAERYAKALFELAEEDNNKDEVRKELRVLTDPIDYDPGLRSVLLEPLHPATERKAVLESLSRKRG